MLAKSKARFEELDSLRGLAALIVVLYHFSVVPQYHNGTLWEIILKTPLRVFVSGTQSVVFFFVLSGFVLSLAFYKDNPPRYPGFLVKRICRLYIPYSVAVCVAIFMRAFFATGSLSHLGIGSEWVTPITPGLVIRHFLLVFNFDNYAFDVVIWSLIHEMRISIIFPLLMILLTRFNWKVSIGLGVLLSTIGIFVQHFHPTQLQPWYKTLPYVFTFTIGAYVAKYNVVLIERYSKMSKVSKVLWLVTGVLLFGSTQWIKVNGPIDDLETIAGASILIVCALSGGYFSRILMIKPIRFLGKISYSLYLYHFIVLLTLMNLLYGKVPMYAILLCTLLLSLSIANLAWWAVERPSIALGRLITRRTENSLQPGKGAVTSA